LNTAALGRGPDPLFDIDGAAVMVTGAARGLGLEMARALAARGARLALVDVDGDAVGTAARELPGALALTADITREETVKAAVAAALARFGRVDAVVNAAGVLTIGAADTLDADAFRRCIDVNLTGAFLVSRTAAKAMDQGGRIVHIASVSSLVANLEYAAYASSKAALSQLVRVLAREWAPRGIAVNAIGPAMIETPMTAGHLDDPEFRERALAAIPMGRFGRPDDLVAALVLLLAPGGAFITGQTIFVDGGRTLV